MVRRGALLLAVSLVPFVLTGCPGVAELKAPVFKTKIAAEETRNSAFKAEFPQQYASYQRNDESTVMTEFNGSVPFNKNDNVSPLPEGYKHAQPYLKNLWLGYVKNDLRYRANVAEPICDLLRFIGREIDKHDPQAWFARVPGRRLHPFP